MGNSTPLATWRQRTVMRCRLTRSDPIAASASLPCGGVPAKVRMAAAPAGAMVANHGGATMLSTTSSPPRAGRALASSLWERKMVLCQRETTQVDACWHQ